MRNKLQQAGLIVLGLVAGIFISLNFSAIAQKEASALPIEELRTFADVFNAIKTGYVEPVEDKKLITQAISGMLTGLDPHSQYLDADAFKDLQVNTQGEFGGLGIEVGMEDGFVKVISPIEDTPAYRAGIKAGDLIVKLDDTPVKGMNLSDAVKRMRGKPKTQITLTIARKGEDKPIIVVITREVIKVQSVKSKVVEPGFAYVRLTQFQEDTANKLADHLGKIWKQGPVKGLVLDLRNDPGGLLHGAVGVSAAFLPPKVLVTSTDGRTEDAKRKYVASPEDYLRGTRVDFLKDLPPGVKTVPMVVLVNGMCGRYEGVDQRVIDLAVDEEISIGDYVLSGGEVPAMAVIEAVARLLPGVLGNPESAGSDSFEQGLLEGPQYTRPAVFRGRAVPDVLLSGNHAAVARWRSEQARETTRRRRPDLLRRAGKEGEER